MKREAMKELDGGSNFISFETRVAAVLELRALRAELRRMKVERAEVVAIWEGMERQKFADNSEETHYPTALVRAMRAALKKPRNGRTKR